MKRVTFNNFLNAYLNDRSTSKITSKGFLPCIIYRTQSVILESHLTVSNWLSAILSRLLFALGLGAIISSVSLALFYTALIAYRYTFKVFLICKFSSFMDLTYSNS